ncbi:MAG TPA: 4'-phosphopantetheinyl transferase superfamily protein [Stellaceae bacterium]|nr:4'-phosphopantetheinyl transferase superfamily protein [Stellaceae bacterium]
MRLLPVAQPTLPPPVEPSPIEQIDATVAGFGAGAAQIFFLALSDFPQSLAEPILTAAEMERARRLVTPPVRRGFVGGRWLLRSVLAALTGAEARLLDIQAGAHGKLFLVGHERLAASFNLSHSGDLLALALVRGRRIGIDIEAERPLTDAALLARRILSPRERERYDALPMSARASALLVAWTRKEAVLKAVGTGVSGGLSTVEVLGDSVVRLGETWSVRSLGMPPGFHGAIAIDRDVLSPLTWQAVPQRESNA